MIRLLEEKDLPYLRKLQTEYEWEFGKDFMLGMAIVDEHNHPVMVVGAWKRAEVHMLANGQWGTPGMRMIALQELHKAMEFELRKQGVGEVHTWLDEMKAFCRRLQALGWGKAKRQMWARRINGS